jgi:glycosyltransferase involved in cell wall biosynthesis
MKIVINTVSARMGGARTYIVNLLSHLPAWPDLELMVFAPDDLELPADPRIRRVRTAWPTTNPLLRTVWERRLLPFYLRRVAADLLFCPGGVLATTVPSRCKTVTMFRNMMPFDKALIQRMPWGLQRLRNLILRRVMLNSMAKADLTIFISDFARRLIESTIRVPNAVTIPHGMNDLFRTQGLALPRPAAIPAGEYLLYVSKFEVYKHHYELVTAYAQLPAPLRQRYALVLVGETDLPDARPVQQLVASLKIGHRVLMLGPVKYTELPPYYNNAAAIIFASSCENCPNILLEALGAGRPVLSSDVMPMPEFGSDAVQYFSPTDPASIREVLRLVLDSEAERGRLAQAAAARGRAFDWAKTAATTWQSILELGPR